MGFMDTITTYRPRISQAFGLAFILLHVFSAKGLVIAAPALTGFLFFLGCLCVGLAMAGQLWCAQYIAGYKNGVLVREGPYSICRNPLYFFSFIGAVGVGLCTESLMLTLLLIAAFAVMYPLTIRNEEATLSRIFGSEYEQYVAEVPRFFPNLKLYHEPKEYMVKPKVFRHAAGDVLWFVGVVGILECLEGLQTAGLIPLLLQIY